MNEKEFLMVHDETEEHVQDKLRAEDAETVQLWPVYDEIPEKLRTDITQGGRRDGNVAAGARWPRGS